MSVMEKDDFGKPEGANALKSTAKQGNVREDDNMQNNQEPEEARKTDDLTADKSVVVPKKSNGGHIFHPQNSKTGMVRPGIRPRTQNPSGGRPQGIQGAPSGRRPQGVPSGARPQGVQGAPAGARPQGVQGAPAGARPQGAQGAPAGARPQGAQGAPTGARPQGAQGAPTGARPQEVQNTAAGTKPQGSQRAASGTRPSGTQSTQNAGAGTARPSGTQNAADEAARPSGVQGTQNAGAGTARSSGTQSSQNAASGVKPSGAQSPSGTKAQAAQEPETSKTQPSLGTAGTKQQNPQGNSGAKPQGNTGAKLQGAQAGTKPSGAGNANTSGQRTQGASESRSQGNPRQNQEHRTREGRTSGERGSQVRDNSRNMQNGYAKKDEGRQGGYGRKDESRGQQGRPVVIPKAPAESKPLEKESRKRTERGDRNRTEKGEKLDRMEKNARQAQKANQKNGQKAGVKKVQPVKAPAPKPVEKPSETIRNITLPEKMTVSELAEAMKIQPSALIKKLFLSGISVTINQEIDFDQAEEIALEFNYICEKEEKVDVIGELLKDKDDPEETLVTRPPVVCVMGHVDHGKTSLLDAIRNTHVIDKEAGGITQHIGAYVATIDGQKITFLDTPGHEAFTAMRMRGANSTDIAILVVAADDGVMPQTVEAINHAKAAGVEIIVAINKIDKQSANIERVKQELSEYGLIPEDWGGKTVVVPVSAHTHEGIDNLLEMILLTAEVMELRANPDRKARGIVIEAQLDKGKGPVATVLVQKGTLHVGDPVAAGSCYGKVRAMMDENGRRVKEAGPSTPVEILGLSDVPNAGDIFVGTESEKESRSFAETFISEGRERMIEDTKLHMSRDDLFAEIQAGKLKVLNLLVKADVQGSVEAVTQSLMKLSNDEVIVKVIHSGVGAINESDVILASASDAMIIGFNTRPDATAKSTAENEKVDIRLYRVIYDAISDVELAMKGMLDPIYEEKVIGHAQVRQLFKSSSVGTIAGSYVLDGIFQRGSLIRISRDGKQIYEGSLASLKRFKDDVKEVRAGYECGLVFEKFNEIQVDDVAEAYIMAEVPR